MFPYNAEVEESYQKIEKECSEDVENSYHDIPPTAPDYVVADDVYKQPALPSRFRPPAPCRAYYRPFQKLAEKEWFYSADGVFTPPAYFGFLKGLVDAIDIRSYYPVKDMHQTAFYLRGIECLITFEKELELDYPVMHYLFAVLLSEVHASHLRLAGGKDRRDWAEALLKSIYTNHASRITARWIAGPVLVQMYRTTTTPQKKEKFTINQCNRFCQIVEFIWSIENRRLQQTYKHITPNNWKCMYQLYWPSVRLFFMDTITRVHFLNRFLELLSRLHPDSECTKEYRKVFYIMSSEPRFKQDNITPSWSISQIKALPQSKHTLPTSWPVIKQTEDWHPPIDLWKTDGSLPPDVGKQQLPIEPVVKPEPQDEEDNMVVPNRAECTLKSTSNDTTLFGREMVVHTISTYVDKVSLTESSPEAPKEKAPTKKRTAPKKVSSVLGKNWVTKKKRVKKEKKMPTVQELSRQREKEECSKEKKTTILLSSVQKEMLKLTNHTLHGRDSVGLPRVEDYRKKT